MRRKKFTVRFFVCLSLVFLFCLSFSAASFATGDGSGGGAGAVVPLYMDWSYPADGASNVSVTPVIHCKFSHNVAQTNVSERNKTLVTLEDENGREVDITVFMADSQIQFDKRQFIYVSPVRPLNYGTTYTLYLHEGIQAKNNMATDEVQTITFTTEYGRSSFNAPLVTPPVTNELAGDGCDETAVRRAALRRTETLRPARRLTERKAAEAAVPAEITEITETRAAETRQDPAEGSLLTVGAPPGVLTEIPVPLLVMLCQMVTAHWQIPLTLRIRTALPALQMLPERRTDRAACVIFWTVSFPAGAD